MSVNVHTEMLQELTEKPETLAAFAGCPGFQLYWRSLGQEEAVNHLRERGLADKLAALAGEGPGGKSIIGALGRISGASIEQQVLRHLPAGGKIDVRLDFIPGGTAPLCAEGGLLAVNAFALKLQANKLYIGGFPLLSLLANRVHRLSTDRLFSKVPEGSSPLPHRFLDRLLQEGCATLFFTVPITGPVSSLWQQATDRREAEAGLLRRFLTGGEGTGDEELERHFSLTGDAALGAKYPLGTWMCTVIEGAFGRDFLVDLLHKPREFLPAFERARVKFSLPDKYSLVAG